MRKGFCSIFGCGVALFLLLLGQQMEATESSQTEALREQLMQLLEANQAELSQRYQQVLRESLFNGRSTMRPNMLKKIAADEVEAFKHFLSEPQSSVAVRGVALHQAGLNEQPVMRLGQAARQFLVTQLAQEQIPQALALFDTYQEQVVMGFVQSLEKAVFTVQERTRHAYERVVHREEL